MHPIHDLRLEAMSALSSRDKLLLASELPLLKAVFISGSMLVDSERIEYRESGNPTLPTAVFLHGLGSSSASFRCQLAGLADSFRVIAWDCPGFGASDGFIEEEPDADRYVEALDAFFVALKIDRVDVLVGSSLGSVIALAYARRHPPKVGRLVLSGTNTACGNVEGRARDRELSAWLQTANTDLPVSRKAVADRLLPPGATGEVRSRVERLRDAMTTRGWQQAIRMLYTVYTPDIVEQIPCRIDLIHGVLDRVAPPDVHASLLVQRNANAKLWLLPDVGHMPKLECPEIFNQIVSR